MSVFIRLNISLEKTKIFHQIRTLKEITIYKQYDL